tara:strand:+ start:78 stop:710 length:633 start_codon:yes stop_codon:yes gene_type:complete
MHNLSLEMQPFQCLTERFLPHQTWAWSIAVMDNTVTIADVGPNATVGCAYPIPIDNSQVNAVSFADKAMAAQVRQAASRCQSLVQAKTVRQQDFLSQRERSFPFVPSTKRVSHVNQGRIAPSGAYAIRPQIPWLGKFKSKPLALQPVLKTMNVQLDLAVKGSRQMGVNSSTSVRLKLKYSNALMEAIKAAATSALSAQLMMNSISVTALC